MKDYFNQNCVISQSQFVEVCIYGRDCTASGNLCDHVYDCFLQLFAVGYGCTNAIQSVFVADQFTEETVSGHDLSTHFTLDKLSSVF